MALKSKDGRWISERTDEEYIQDLQAEIAALAPEEREAMELMLSGQMAEDGVSVLEHVYGAQYERPMVDVRTWLKDEKHFGNVAKDLYPRLVEDFVELFDGRYEEVILTGSIGLDALIQEADGGLPTLRERIGISKDVVVALDSGMDTSKTDEAHRSGVKKVLRVTLANGMSVDLTPEHEVRIYEGGHKWRRADGLGVGDYVIVPRKIKTTPSRKLNKKLARILAYWNGDGSSSHFRARFCDGNPKTSEEVLRLIRELGFSGRRYKKGENCWEVHTSETVRSGFVEMLKRHDADKKTNEVVVPQAVCKSDNAVVAEYLSALWACKGSIYAPEHGKSPPRIVLAMKSERFIRQAQLLLLRFGVMGRIRHTFYKDNRNGKDRDIWVLQVSGAEQLKLFLDSIGMILGKEDACERVLKYCDKVQGNTNVDVVPLSWGELNDLMIEHKIVRRVGNYWWTLGSQRERKLSRSMLKKWASEYGETRLGEEVLGEFPEGLAFERVTEIEDIVVNIETGDIGAENGNRFLANGISVHNSIGWGKCTNISSTYITNAFSGERKLLKDMIGETPLVPSLHDDGKIAPAIAKKIWRSGVKRCIKLTLASGQWLEASYDHPVLTPRGYVRLSELKIDDMVAAARTSPEPEASLDISDSEVLAIGFLLADGCGLATGCQTYCKGNPELVKMFEAAVCEVPGFSGFGKKEYKRGAWYVPSRGTSSWIREWGLNKNSKDKRIDGRLFGLRRSQLALLIKAIWTDGNVYTGTPRKIELCLASEGMIDDVQEMLRRFGIVARKTFKSKSIKSKDGTIRRYDAWRLQIADAVMLRLFMSEIGDIFGLGEECDELRRQLEDVKSNPNWDVVPIKTAELSEIRAEVGPLTNEAWIPYESISETSFMGRDKFRRLVEHFGYKGKYAKFAHMDVVWERVKSLDDIGDQEVADLTVPGPENVVANGVVVHNTFFATLIVCRMLYELSCLRSPQRTWGLAEGSTVALVGVGANILLARKVVFDNISSKVGMSPYFTDVFPVKQYKKEIRCPKNIWITPMHSNSSAGQLGLNVYGGIIDEMNFLGKLNKLHTASDEHETWGDSVGGAIYAEMHARIQSRFARAGRIPGKLILVSSKRTTDDFLERKVLESRTNPKVFVRDYVAWDVKPKTYFLPTRFRVLVGAGKTRSRILRADEVIDAEILDERAAIAEIPDDFRQDFVNNLERAIRDIAGVAMDSVMPFIHRTEKVEQAFSAKREHPFTCLEWVPTSKRDGIIWEKLAHRDGKSGNWKALVNPGIQRHVHIDPSQLVKGGDAVGLCVAHISGWTSVARRNERGEAYAERSPIIYIDFVLRIVPPGDEEGSLGDVRSLVYALKEHGIPIRHISMDRHQSAESMWKFKKNGFDTNLVSVDMSPEPYELLKSAMYEDRVDGYPYWPLKRELLRLEWDERRGKVDHPSNGCFTGDTRVALLDGTLPTFEELGYRFKAGEKFAVYSIGDDGVCVGWARDPRITRRNAELVEVVLDNYQVVQCTPDHLFMTLGGDWVKAENLTPGVRLMPLYRSSVDKGGWPDYEKLWCPKRKKRILTHHMVAEQTHGSRGDFVVHHKNERKMDNRPENLEIICRSEHVRHHTQKRHMDESYVRKLRAGHKKYVDSVGRQKSRENILRLFEEGKLKRGKEICAVEECEKLQNAKGLCGAHYQRLRRERAKGARFSCAQNHRILSVKKISVRKDVWDISVDDHQNFALAAGVFVHNSKDVADAVASVVYTLTKSAGGSMPIMPESSASSHVEGDESWIFGGMKETPRARTVKPVYNKGSEMDYFEDDDIFDGDSMPFMIE